MYVEVTNIVWLLLQAERRNQSAGLGMKGSKVNIEEGDNYKMALKKTLFARYNDLDWTQCVIYGFVEVIDAESSQLLGEVIRL